VWCSAIYQGELYVGGSFAFADGESTPGIARWDGVSWRAVGSGITFGAVAGHVRSMVVWDDGSGPELYVGGNFTSAGSAVTTDLARWDGTEWRRVGGPGVTGSGVDALAVYDAGTGAHLYIGGNFTLVGGLNVSNVARYDGVNWMEMGSGTIGTVQALLSHDDGNGALLYACGGFVQAGGAPNTDVVAAWDGDSWSAAGNGAVAGGIAYDLVEFDDGSGNALHLVGDMIGGIQGSTIGAKLQGGTWSFFGLLLRGWRGNTAVVYDDGSGPALFVGGYLQRVEQTVVKHFAKFDGSAWSALPSDGVSQVHSLLVFDDGSGEKLLVGGQFDEIGPSPGTIDAGHLAGWDGSAWSGVGNEPGGASDSVLAFAEFDEGSGPRMFAGGNFTRIGGQPLTHVARREDTGWSSVGGGMNERVRAFIVHDDGTTGGQRLYAGGKFTQAGGVPVKFAARWDGTAWEAVGNLDSLVRAFIVYDDGSGSALYAGGGFSNGVARWDGSSFATVGTGLTNGHVHDFAAFDDGSGMALYAVGDFLQAGGNFVGRVARWDGASWNDIGANLNITGRAAEVFNDGSGKKLFIAGSFTFAGGTGAPRVVRWDGTSFVYSGFGLSTGVYDLETFDDGTGKRLIAGSNVDVHEWTGSQWTRFETGVGDRVDAAFAEGQQLWLGGRFTQAGGMPSDGVALWAEACSCPAQNFCTAGTSASGCRATVSASGTASVTSPSGFTVTASDVEGKKPGFFFYGFNGQQSKQWGNGTSYLCVLPPSKRTPLVQGVGTTGLCDGAFSLDLNAYWQTAPANKVPSGGEFVSLQLWYRDPFTTSNLSRSLSDGVSFWVCP
jgi:hypothetical protein